MVTAYVGGTAVSIGWADQRSSLTELIYQTVTEALSDAEAVIDDFDAVVCACHDLVDGRSLSSMITAPAAGAYMKDEVRVSDDGAVALALATARVEAGLSDGCLVVAWGRASESSVDAVSGTAYDPFFHRPFGITDLAVSRMRAARWFSERDLSDDERRTARRERSLRASNAPNSAESDLEGLWPLRDEELPRFADVVAALTLSPRSSDVAVAGVGQASEPYRPEDRPLLRFDALTRAGDRALGEAGTSAHELSMVEVDGMTLFDEAIAIESLGLAEPGRGIGALSQNPHWNASGGSAAGYCPPAMGLVRCVSAVRGLRDLGGGYALGTGAGPVSAQTQTAVVFKASQ